MGTHHPAAMPPLAARCAERGVVLLDAPVSGGEVGAIEGSLSIMVGGDAAAFERARPVFEAMGRTIVHVGGSGAGQMTKACNQLIVGATIAAVAEGLTLARAAGVDPAVVRTALTGGYATSRVLDIHGGRMIERNFTPGGRAALHAKDAHIILDTAARLGVDLPVFSVVADRFDRLVAAGGGDLDHSALITLLEADGIPADAASRRRRSPGLAPDREDARRVRDQQVVDLRLGDADVAEHRHEAVEQVAVADAAEPFEVAREADVLRDQQPLAVARVDDRLDVARPLLVGLQVAEADVVDLDVDALLEQPELVLDVPLVPVVADDDPVGRRRPPRTGSRPAPGRAARSAGSAC